MLKITFAYISAAFSIVLCFISAHIYFNLVNKQYDEKRRFYAILSAPDQILLVTQEGPRPGVSIDDVWHISESLAEKVLTQLYRLQNRPFRSYQGTSLISEDVGEYFYQFSGVYIDGIKYIHINAAYRDEFFLPHFKERGLDNAIVVNDGGGFILVSNISSVYK